LFPPHRVTLKAIVMALSTCIVGCAIAVAQVSPLPERRATAGETSQSRVGSSPARALIDAVQNGDLADASALVEHGAQFDRCVPGDGTPLTVAARAGAEKIVQLLLAGGADANRPCAGDGNPLIMTALSGNMTIARALVEHGADVNGFVPGDETPLISAARVGRLELVQYLVERGADVNLAVPSGNAPGHMRSPLSEARKWRRNDVIGYLQAHGAQ
jgi:ankyrin repeat protein